MIAELVREHVQGVFKQERGRLAELGKGRQLGRESRHGGSLVRSVAHRTLAIACVRGAACGGFVVDEEPLAEILDTIDSHTAEARSFTTEMTSGCSGGKPFQSTAHKETHDCVPDSLR